MPQRRWVNLVFMRGAHLPDPQGLIEGMGKNVRHVKFRRLADVTDRAEAVKALLSAATSGQPTAR